MDKEFIVGKVFEKIETKKISGKANDFPKEPDDEYTIPLLTAGVENQGLARYAMRSQCPNILSNVLSVSANGVNSGVVFYHPEEFAVLQDAYAIKVRKYEIPNPEVGLYLTTVLYKALATKYDWHYKAGWNRVQEEKILLPIQTDENNNPIIDETNLYHEEGFIPDWKYMEKRVAELEELRVAELAAYLEETGLIDYILTEQEEKLLLAEPEMAKFKLSDLFESFNGDTDLQKTHMNGLGYDVVSSGRENHGIIGKTDVEAKIFNADTITIDMFGNCYYRDSQYKMVTHARVFSLSPLFEGLNNVNGQYIVSQFQHLPVIYNYSNMCSWKKIKNDTISLPIQTDEYNNPVIDQDKTYHPEGYIPDWDFMERYIRAIEKVVIADVVKYKDEVITKTKEVIHRDK